jgi:hypothetical protein
MQIKYQNYPYHANNISLTVIQINIFYFEEKMMHKNKCERKNVDKAKVNRTKKNLINIDVNFFFLVDMRMTHDTYKHANEIERH